MAIILFILTFLGIHAGCYKFFGKSESQRAILLMTITIFSAVLVGITELLSVGTILNFKGLGIAYFSLFIGLLVVLSKQGFITYLEQWTEWFKQIKNQLKQFKLLDKITFYPVLIILIVTFLQGFIYPPNTWDSMTYHLQRVVHWISFESVAHYPTSDYRQLYQPPLAEFFFLHINLLFGSDLLSNLVQWSFLIGTCFSATLLAKAIGLKGYFEWLPFMLICTIPIVIFQASSTKNYLVQAFFLLESVRYILKLKESPSWQTMCLLGCTIGLSLLAKATSYIFLFPILLVYGIWLLKKAFKGKNYKPIYTHILLVGFFAIGINGGHYARGFHLTGNPLGITQDKGPKVTIEDLSIGMVTSNILRNTALHLGPFPLSRISEFGVKKIHNWLNLDVHKETSYQLPFKITNYPNGVGDAPNPIHLVLTILTFGMVLIKKNTWLLKIGVWIFFCQFILFCGYLKWEPWHARLHSPLFILATPMIAYCLKSYLNKDKILLFIAVFLTGYGLSVLPFCNSRPLIPIKILTAEISPTADRFRKYFSGRPEIYNDYFTLQQAVNQGNYQNIGSEIEGAANWSYPLYNEIYSKKFKVYNINIKNFTKNINQTIPNLDCIITHKVNQDSLIFQDNIFRKKELGAENLFFYERSKKSEGL